MARQRRGQERAPTVHTPVVVVDNWTHLTMTQSDEIMQELCEFISREGTIKRFGFKYSVSPGHIWKFVNEHPARREMYRQAMQARAQSVAGRIAKSGDRVERLAKRLVPETGRVDSRDAQAAIAAERLLQDNLKWRAAKDDPEAFGERTTQVLEGGQNPIKFSEELTESEMSRRMAFILSKGLKDPPSHARGREEAEIEVSSINHVVENRETEISTPPKPINGAHPENEEAEIEVPLHIEAQPRRKAKASPKKTLPAKTAKKRSR